MDAIVYGVRHPILSKVELLAAIEQGWNGLNAYVDSLTPEQLTTPTDAAGWTAKDHLAHLAVWEDTINALLDKKPRAPHVGIDQALWDSQEFDTQSTPSSSSAIKTCAWRRSGR